jgi:transposase
LGRRGGPRRRRPVEEKRRIVEETLEPGASVAVVARRHELNANVVFLWRRLYRAGRLGSESAAADAKLIPVKVMAPDPRGAIAKSRSKTASPGDAIEVLLADGTRVRIGGDLAHEALRQIIAVVRGR